MISAIQYFPLDNPDAEFIHIYNPSDRAVDIEGYSLANAIDFAFPAGSIIEGDETILIAKDLSLITENIDKKYQWTRGRLSNEGENIELIAPSGIIEDHVRYDNKAPWPLEAEGQGSFLKLKDPRLDNHFAESWTSQLSTSTFDFIGSSDHFIAYPNPAKNFLTIKSKDSIINSIEILNVHGQSAYFLTTESREITMNIQDLKTGIYFIRINGIMNNTIMIQK